MSLKSIEERAPSVVHADFSLHESRSVSVYFALVNKKKSKKNFRAYTQRVVIAVRDR